MINRAQLGISSRGSLLVALPHTREGSQGASCVALPRPVTFKSDVFIFLPPDTRQVNIRAVRCGVRLKVGKHCPDRPLTQLSSEMWEREEERGGAVGGMGGK
ncbi:hypothetical protein E2C01_085457 [Portunus trituberculatus]|uniref:Uncharacterized protein n=1 Tax=Portunus trituberculatus TaxID=210409 RepID=A0A5B7J6T1_PORTR|nr:hypothetical protein [Portunus trituberculatus]